MTKISFIIPVYNVEKHLRRCLDSIRNQGDPCFEAILVDDGSTDTSGEICKEYTRQDSRFTYHYMKNAWVAAARNMGLRLAKAGEYVSFVDSDDYIEPNYIETLYAHAKETSADILVFGHKRNDGGNIVNEAPAYRIIEPDENSLLEHFCRDWLHCARQNYVWSKLYCRSFLDNALDNAGEFFSTGLRAAEDRNFLYKVIIRSKRTVYVSESPYFYFQHSESMTRSSESSTIRFFKSYLDSYRNTIDYWSKVGFDTFDCVKPIVLFHALQSAFFNASRSLGSVELVADVAVQALEGFPLHDEFEPIRLNGAIATYSDICGLNWAEQSKIWLFALSLMGGKDAILAWQRLCGPYSDLVVSDADYA